VEVPFVPIQPNGDLVDENDEWLTPEAAALALGVDQAEIIERVRDRARPDAFPLHRIRQNADQVRVHRGVIGASGAMAGEDPVHAELDELRAGIQLQEARIRLLESRLRELERGPARIEPAANARRSIALPAIGPRLLIDRWVGLRVPGQIRYGLAIGAVAAVLGWILFSDVGSNPVGFFCDEAEIGLETRKLLRDGLPHLRPSLFYHHFEYAHLGSLPLYAGAPVIAILGIGDTSVRLASVIWAVLALLMLVILTRRLRWRNGEIAVALFGATPVFIHLSRVNFGHAPSMFCVSAGLYAYARGRSASSWRWPALAGAALGASAYGQAAWYIAAPIVVAGLATGEIVVNRIAWRAYRQLGVAMLAFLLSWTPVIFKAVTDDSFLKRFREKEATNPSFVSGAHLREVIDNYPKYFDPDYLFRVGEVSWNTRHSVPGAGILTWITLPLVVAGILAIFRIRDDASRVLGVTGLVMLALYPVPDLITTTSINAPYTVSIFSTMIFVPLLAGLGIHWVSGWVQGRRATAWSSWLLPGSLLAIILIGAVRFNTGPYERYPEISAGYYGWQFGPEQAIEVFKQHPEGYDRYVLDGDFNDAFVFLDFYLVDDHEIRRRSIIGGLEKVDGQRTELYAIRAEKYDAFLHSSDRMRRYARLIDTIRYPSGQMAIYLVEVGPTDQWGPRPVPS
jgi:hypothetical protein